MSVTTFISSLLPPISSSLNNTLTPHEPHYPIYHTRENSILPFMTDKFLSLLIPIVAYWVFSLLFHALDCLELPYFEKMRIHESEEVQSRNRVTVWGVIKAVLLQQFFQTALGWVWLESEQEILEREIWRDHTADMQKLAGVVGQGLHLLLGGKTAGIVAQALGGGNLTAWVYWWGVPIVQMVFAFFIIDTWQYFLHRLFHTVPFLYRHFHSVHHALYVPYAFGALYNHPVEGLLLDSLGAVLAHSISGMTIRQSILLFGISTVKTVDDHCGYKIWWDPCQAIFGNNAEYHDLHHQSWGIKKNFSQPFFTRWDDLLGTRMDKDHAVTMYSKRKASALAKKNAMLAVEEVEVVEITPSAITTTSSITTSITTTKPIQLERKSSSSSETSSVSISDSDRMTPVEEIDSGIELDDPKSTIATGRRATGMGTRLRSRA